MGLSVAVLDQSFPAMLLALGIWIITVWAVTWLRLRRASRDTIGFEDRFWSGGSLEQLQAEQPAGVTGMAAVFRAGMTEWQRGALILDTTRVTGWTDRAMEAAVQRESAALERCSIYLPASAITAALGGLAGALATDARELAASGFCVAIVAVVAHVTTSTRMRAFEMRLHDFAGELGSILERQAQAAQLSTQTMRAA